MRLLRDILNDYKPQSHAAQVLSIIFTVAIADLAAGRPERLFAHRQAVNKVLDSCGGSHYILEAVPLAVQLDRVIAITTNLPPLCTTWASVTLPVQRAAFYPAIYGSFFTAGNDARVNLIDKDISNYCSDVCRAIEILEGENWSFIDEIPNTNSSEIYYFYYLRERVAGQFAHLNARFASADSREQCVLLATKIIEYLLFMDNYVVAITVNLATRLQSILVKHDLAKVWQGWEDVLLWITFVLVCMPNQWSGRAWSIELCGQTYQHLYGAEWPDSWVWEKIALAEARSFVWSSRIDGALSDAWQSLTEVIEEKM